MNNFNLTMLKAGFVKELSGVQVFPGLANNEFTGEINKKNDKVKLIQLGNVNVGAYSDSSDITVQDISESALEITADNDDYFAYAKDTAEINDIKSAWYSEAARKSAIAMADNIDIKMAALYTQAGLTISGNTDSACIDVTSLNVEDVCLEMAEVFALAKIPRAVRKAMIVPPWFITKLTNAAINAKTDNTALYQAGYVMTALGWDFIESPNVSKGAADWTQSRIMCVVPGQSLGYAGAVTVIETQQQEKRIGKTQVAGRYVFGYKVVRPDMTGVLYLDKTAEPV